MDLRLSPGFLIAMPQLTDPNFVRTVVLMLHHDAEGAMGLVVNRRTDVELADFCEQHELPYGGEPGERLFFGGPCELQRGFLLHQEPSLGEHRIEVAPGLFLSTEISTVRTVLAKARSPFRFLLGYAGWGADQLEREIGQGAWLTSEARATRVFDGDPDTMWTCVLGDLGIDPARLAVSTERH
jgi:putative transcriptional regulator